MPSLVCKECREEKPYLLGCIHTFAPRARVSSISEREDWREGLKDVKPYDEYEK